MRIAPVYKSFTAIFGVVGVVLMSTALALGFVRPVVAAGIITVPDDYAKIQWAIGNATAGDTIFVRPGTYYENVTVDKPLTLQGENKLNTVIDGKIAGTVVRVAASAVNVTGFTIQNSGKVWPNSGIHVDHSSGVSVSQNILVNNLVGIYLDYSNSNTVLGNIATLNRWGIAVENSPYNTLRNNNMTGNRWNLDVWGWPSPIMAHFLNDIDTSNTVDEKPVYYLINQKDRVIEPSTFLKIGYLGLVNSRNITIRGLAFTHSGQGVLLAYTNGSRVENVSVSESWCGIYLVSSVNNIIVRCNLFNNTESGASGMFLGWSFNNTVYHNNFVDNEIHVWTSNIGANVWDDGYPFGGGNYWSDYAGVDANQDGIGDSSYLKDSSNIDRYPLMGLFSDFSVSWGGETFYPNTVSNSTISAFELDQMNKKIMFNVTGELGIGFCRICIPHNLMGPPYVVTVDGHAPLYVNNALYDNSTHRWTYFTYQHSTHEVEIIPEFSVWASTLLMLIMLAVAIVICKRRTRNPLIY